MNTSRAVGADGSIGAYPYLNGAVSNAAALVAAAVGGIEFTGTWASGGTPGTPGAQSGVTLTATNVLSFGVHGTIALNDYVYINRGQTDEEIAKITSISGSDPTYTIGFTTTKAHSGTPAITKVAGCDAGQTAVARQRCMYALIITNPHTALVYVQFFDAALAALVTVGTTTPKQSYGVAPNGGTLQLSFADIGVRFDQGIVIASTTGYNNAAAPGTATVVNLTYS